MATKAQGTILQFIPNGGSQVTVGKLTSIGEIAPSASEIDVTTLDATNGYRQYIQGFRDAGELTLSGFHDNSDEGQEALRTAFNSGAVGTVVIAFPDGTEVRFSAFVKAHSIGAAEVDGAVGFGATLRLTGPVTVTAG